MAISSLTDPTVVRILNSGRVVEFDPPNIANIRFSLTTGQFEEFMATELRFTLVFMKLFRHYVHIVSCIKLAHSDILLNT